MKRIIKTFLAVAVVIICTFACACSNELNIGNCAGNDNNVTIPPTIVETLESEYSIGICESDNGFYDVILEGYVIVENVPNSITVKIDGVSAKVELKTISRTDAGNYKVGFDEALYPNLGVLKANTEYTATVYLHYTHSITELSETVSFTPTADYERVLVCSYETGDSFIAWDVCSNWTKFY